MERVKQFHQALMDAFTSDELDMLLRHGFDKRLDKFTSDKKPKDSMFLDVIDASVAGGWMLELAEQAFMERSGNEKIRAFYENHVDRRFHDDHPPRRRTVEQKPRRRTVEQKPRRRTVEQKPYYLPESNDISERVRMLEILWRGVDGYNGALSKIRHLERLFWMLVALRILEMAYVVVWR